MTDWTFSKNSHPTISFSVLIEGRRQDPADPFKWVTLISDLLIEGPTLPATIRRLYEELVCIARKRHISNMHDVQFHVTRMNPDVSGGDLNGPLRTWVVLDSVEALRGVGMVLTMLVNEYLRKRGL
jgi:hypothetical protein